MLIILKILMDISHIVFLMAPQKQLPENVARAHYDN